MRQGDEGRDRAESVGLSDEGETVVLVQVGSVQALPLLENGGL